VPAAKDADKEDKERIARQRVILRIVAELAVLSAWPEGAAKGAGELGKVLQALVSRSNLCEDDSKLRPDER